MLRPWLDNLWRWKCGMKEVDLQMKHHPPPDEIAESQIHKEFILRMRRAMINGFFRYGTGKGDGCNVLEALEERLTLYKKSWDASLLVDVANFAMLEFRKQQVHFPTRFLKNMGKADVVHARKQDE